MNKREKFEALVAKRKQDVSFPDGLLNPSKINPEYDSEISLNPYDKWQNNLDSKILIIAQDWSDERYFLNNKGKDQDDNPTNKNLIELIKIGTGVKISPPSHGNNNSVFFFTNTVIGIKPTEAKGMSSPLKSSWVNYSIEHYLKPLIEIIEPKYIVTLGKTAYKAIASIYDLPEGKKMTTLIEENPIRLSVKDIKIFSFYHCGSLGLVNRKLDSQKKDWEALKLQLQIDKLEYDPDLETSLSDDDLIRAYGKEGLKELMED